MDWMQFLIIILYGLLIGWIFQKIIRYFKKKRTHCQYLKGVEFTKNYSKNQLIDVRTKEEYRFEHILGARNVPLNKIVDAHTLLHRNKPVYLYCQSGKRAKKAARKLLKQEFKNIVVLNDNLSNFNGKIVQKSDK